MGEPITIKLTSNIPPKKNSRINMVKSGKERRKDEGVQVYIRLK